MPCQINNSSNIDMSSLEPHVQGMYDYFDQKLGFNKPPAMHFDSDPGNQANVLGKTAYYDPSNLQIHVFTDGRHPKDMLRSIAHELIHHQQNLEGRLDVGGYMGEGYYLKNEAMRELEQEAMLQGNALMREYEDTIKSEESNKMSLKEWKNNELNGLLLKKFGILKEEKKPDADGDGVPDWADKKPGEDDHAEDKKEEMNEEVVEEEQLDEYSYEQEMADRDTYKGPRGKPTPPPEPKELSYSEKRAADKKARGQRTMAQASIPRQFRENKVKKGIQETLKRISRAKSITIRGKKIK